MKTVVDLFGRSLGDNWRDAQDLAFFLAQARRTRFRVHGIRLGGQWRYIVTEILP